MIVTIALQQRPNGKRLFRDIAVQVYSDMHILGHVPSPQHRGCQRHSETMLSQQLSHPRASRAIHRAPRAIPRTDEETSESQEDFRRTDSRISGDRTDRGVSVAGTSTELYR